MGESRGQHRIPHGALIAIACGVLIGACGSSGKPSTTAASVHPGVRFAQCMRAHGEPDFPDPDADRSPGHDARACTPRDGVCTETGHRPPISGFQAGSKGVWREAPGPTTELTSIGAPFRPPPSARSRSLQQRAAAQSASTAEATAEGPRPEPPRPGPVYEIVGNIWGSSSVTSLT